nr:Maf family protein [Conexibacter sp. DBS9H8]
MLASGSPQRRAILEQLGVPFQVAVSGVSELDAGPPEEVVLENAYRKARAVAGPGGAELPVLGVDTEVALGGTVLGQPAGAAGAREMLGRLSGRAHRVLSGVCVIEGERVRTAAAATTVRFRSCPPELLDWYVATGEWAGRAGGYAIQCRGVALIEGIEGDYSNVVGLPVPTLLDLLGDLLQ